MSQNAQRIIDAIEEAFGDVQLEDGISVREAVVLDRYGSEEERQSARSQDEAEDWRSIRMQLLLPVRSAWRIWIPKVCTSTCLLSCALHCGIANNPTH